MNDEEFYERATLELVESGPKAGLWAKAFAETDGDAKRTQAYYLRLRVDQLKAALELERRQVEENRQQERREALGRLVRRQVPAEIVIGSIFLVLFIIVLIAMATIR